MSKQILDLQCPVSTVNPAPLAKMGGKDKNGRTINVNDYYFEIDGKPTFFACGEFQFSRFPAYKYWEEELLKMKAGGINAVQSYVFWLHHEPIRGKIDFSKERNIRLFAELCQKHELWFFPRIGPYLNAECRNGGFPDWIMGLPLEPRSNDPAYLELVRGWYSALADQLKGLLFMDGGTIIGMQLENEFQHCGIGWEAGIGLDHQIYWTSPGLHGADHILRLKEIAKESGLDVPFYFATSWGSPIPENEVLPVTGAYAYLGKPTINTSMYIFNDRRKRVTLVDCKPGLSGTYPYINMELQGGSPVCYPHDERQVVPPKSTEAAALVQLGQGCNFLGYYIYHGGTNPMLFDMVKGGFRRIPLSYDFQAPIGEYGEVRDACRYLKNIHLFLQTFGEKIAIMPVFVPEIMQNTSLLSQDEIREKFAKDPSTPRYCARAITHDGVTSGFLFLNSFQSHVKMNPVTDLSFELGADCGKISIPSEGTFDLPADECCIFPFNLDISNIRLRYALAQPLTKLKKEHGKTTYFFFAVPGIVPQYCFIDDGIVSVTGDLIGQRKVDGMLLIEPAIGADKSIELLSSENEKITIITLSRQEAEHTWVGIYHGERRVIISPDADPIFRDTGLELRFVNSTQTGLKLFPGISKETISIQGGSIAAKAAELPDMSSMIVSVSPGKATDAIKLTTRLNHDGYKFSDSRLWLQFNHDLLDGLIDMHLQIDYIGDIGQAFINGKMVAENYWNGTIWNIGLKRFMPDILNYGLCFFFRPIRKGKITNESTDMTFLYGFEGEERFELKSIKCVPEYGVVLS